MPSGCTEKDGHVYYNKHLETLMYTKFSGTPSEGVTFEECRRYAWGVGGERLKIGGACTADEKRTELMKSEFVRVGECDETGDVNMETSNVTVTEKIVSKNVTEHVYVKGIERLQIGKQTSDMTFEECKQYAHDTWKTWHTQGDPYYWAARSTRMLGITKNKVYYNHEEYVLNVTSTIQCVVKFRGFVVLSPTEESSNNCWCEVPSAHTCKVRRKRKPLVSL